MSDIVNIKDRDDEDVKRIFERHACEKGGIQRTKDNKDTFGFYADDCSFCKEHKKRFQNPNLYKLTK